MIDHAPGRSFDGSASAYRRGRPGYPAHVYALLAQRCGLGAGCAVLEIGAGTGQATLPLLDSGADVTAVEPGAALVRELEAHCAGRRLRVVNATFEDAVLPESAFDIVASATAFHWVDPAVRMVKSAAVLRDGGWLAVWNTQFGDPTRADPFHDAIQPLLAEHAPEIVMPLPAAPDNTAPGLTGDPAATEHFEAVERHELRWQGQHDPAAVRALFATFSPWLALQAERRERLLDALENLARIQFAGRVVRPYITFVELRRRTPRSRSGDRSDS